MNFKYLLCIFTVAVLSCSTVEKVELNIGSNVLLTEVAHKPEERSKGLMNRETLGENEGMIFVFDKEDKVSFWMKNTSIPLSIAYINKQGKILEIYDLKPYSLEGVVSKRSSILYALEVNRGYFSRNGIGIGDSIELEPVKRYLNSSR